MTQTEHFQDPLASRSGTRNGSAKQSMEKLQAHIALVQSVAEDDVESKRQRLVSYLDAARDIPDMVSKLKCDHHLLTVRTQLPSYDEQRALRGDISQLGTKPSEWEIEASFRSLVLTHAQFCTELAKIDPSFDPQAALTSVKRLETVLRDTERYVPIALGGNMASLSLADRCKYCAAKPRVAEYNTAIDSLYMLLSPLVEAENRRVEGGARIESQTWPEPQTTQRQYPGAFPPLKTVTGYPQEKVATHKPSKTDYSTLSQRVRELGAIPQDANGDSNRRERWRQEDEVSRGRWLVPQSREALVAEWRDLRDTCETLILKLARSNGLEPQTGTTKTRCVTQEELEDQQYEVESIMFKMRKRNLSAQEQRDLQMKLRVQQNELREIQRIHQEGALRSRSRGGYYGGPAPTGIAGCLEDPEIVAAIGQIRTETPSEVGLMVKKPVVRSEGVREGAAPTTLEEDLLRMAPFAVAPLSRHSMF
ncbi:hypothetical protein KIPB_001313 [Kipferlia bialata]|uniref:Uncharacterized protein n=1 Tax=Kipferlia bialata TaxID=797122 RepID=A0A9K3GFG6_9EUKA|nr:hypothetical protein KIPB_001313 [Kipferlia bialata]|eukprot:g1313.t1